MSESTPLEADSCDYIYLLQPPSELPCNPYRENELTGVQEYSVSFQCAVAQTSSDKDESEIYWMGLTQDSEQERVPSGLNGPYKQSAATSVIRGTIIHTSVLEIASHPPPTTIHSYWCELSTPDSKLKTNSSTLQDFANRVTVYGPDFYSSFSPCPPEAALHLAESVCVSSSLLDDQVTIEPCPSGSESCSNGIDTGSGSTQDNTTAAVNTAVIVGAGVGGGVIIVLVGLCCVLVLFLCHRRRKNKDLNGELIIQSMYLWVAVKMH